MKCSMCDGDLVIKNDFLPFKSKSMGEVIIPNVELEECQGCRVKLLSPDASHYVTSYVKELEKTALNNLPAGDLITASEAANILGITKQGFSKSPRIRRGFIYSVKIGNRKLYSKRSTELYSETKDGRFRLNAPSESASKIYIISPPTPLLKPQEYIHQTEEQQPADLWCLEDKTRFTNDYRYQTTPSEYRVTH